MTENEEDKNDPQRAQTGTDRGHHHRRCFVCLLLCRVPVVERNGLQDMGRASGGTASEWQRIHRTVAEGGMKMSYPNTGYCPDNYDLWEAHERRQNRQLSEYPVCAWCGENIQSEECYEINDELYCQNCVERNFKRSTADYME